MLVLQTAMVLQTAIEQCMGASPVSLKLPVSVLHQCSQIGYYRFPDLSSILTSRFTGRREDLQVCLLPSLDNFVKAVEKVHSEFSCSVVNPMCLPVDIHMTMPNDNITMRGINCSAHTEQQKLCYIVYILDEWWPFRGGG